jgi:hypothetical protein
MFLKGLMNGGVPIKFATYNNYKSTTSGASSVNIQIQERGRSVKSIFALQRRDPTTFTSDSGASFFCTGTNSTLPPNGGLVTLQEYQYRIGGRYYIIFKKDISQPHLFRMLHKLVEIQTMAEQSHGWN